MPMLDLAVVVENVAIRPDGCWEWTGWSNGRGYGQVKFAGRRHYAHRLVYELTVGAIPDGLVIDHLCRNTKCVRPDHLEPVTQRENVLRGIGPAARRAVATHCEHGHRFDEANTYLLKNGKGSRICRACRAWRERERRARLRTNGGTT